MGVLIGCWSGLSWQSDPVLLLLLLLTGDAVLLSLVTSGAGGDEHLPLTKKLTMQCLTERSIRVAGWLAGAARNGGLAGAQASARRTEGRNARGISAL